MHQRLYHMLPALVVLGLGIAVPGSPIAARGEWPAAAAAGTHRYIVELADPPLAAYAGTFAGSSDTVPERLADGAGHGMDGPAAEAYDRYLRGNQAALESLLRTAVPSARVEYHYRVALNAVTVRLPESEVATLRALPGVVAVTREEPLELLMDASLPQIEAPAAWPDPRVGGRSAAGRGVRIAVIDSGITAEHPMFDDTDFTAPPGFPRSTLTVGDAVIAYDSAQIDRFTNNKVIVARVYANPEVYDPSQPVTPLADGAGGFHGAHVAGIAGGSVVNAASDGTGAVLSGVAPGAYIMAYKITNAYTPELLRAIDDAVADGADVINNSWGTAAMNVVAPERHPVARAFKNAAAAGVVVVAASGNAGSNGEATLGGPHQMIDEVITVANVQTGRTFGTFVLARDAGLPAPLERHPAQQYDMGNTWESVTAQTLASDLCQPLDLLRARGKVVLMPADAACENSIIQLPIELPEQLKFLQSLLVARLAGAEAVVMVAETAEERTQRQLILAGLDLVIGAGGEATGQFQFPITALIAGDDAVALAEWSAGHPSLVIDMSRAPVPIADPGLTDAAHESSSRGPAPYGPAAPAKPDLAAPGSNILSAATAADGSPDGFAAATGTSMAAPHVAGAAAVLRAAWPTWTPAEIKAALLTTADPIVTVEGAPAPTIVQGAGRLNLRRALDPGLLVSPPSLNLLPEGGSEPENDTGPVWSLRLRDVRLDPRDDIVYAVRHEPGPGNDRVTVDTVREVVVPEAGETSLTVRFEATDGPSRTYDGWIVLEGDARTVRVFYQATWPRPRDEARADVLLLSVRRSALASSNPIDLLGPPRFEDTADYSSYWTAALDEAGLTYDVWRIAETAESSVPPLSVLRTYEVVMVIGGDGNAPLALLPGGMTALQMYLLGGGRLIVSGNRWDHGPPSIDQLALQQNNGSPTFLSRYFAGFERTRDDVAVEGPLAAADSAASVLFPEPIGLAEAETAESAGNGGRIDVGRPLARLQTETDNPMQPPIDIGLAAPLVVEKTMPYMRAVLVTASGDAAMTSVTADATLELPAAADFIPWRAAFAGFPMEAVGTAPDRLSRGEVLARLHAWSVEPDDVRVAVRGPEVGEVGGRLRFEADLTSAGGVEAVAWRWDAGDGRPYASTETPTFAPTFERPGAHTIRVEAITSAGHTYVSAKRVRIGGLFVPAASRRARLGAR